MLSTLKESQSKAFPALSRIANRKSPELILINDRIMSQPKVIACGHKYFSAKTGNSFPAFLVQFSSLREPFDDYCASSSKNYRSDGDYGTKMCCFWRSKHDFLLVRK